MKISKSNAARLGHIIAEALHACENSEQRKGVLIAREAIQDALRRDCQRSDADWQRYCAFMNRFDARLDYLEPLDTMLRASAPFPRPSQPA
jgi:hypothetical protein